MIWPSDALLLMTTLIGNPIAARGGELGHQHGKPPVTDEGDALPAGWAIWLAIVYGSPGAIVARLPER